MAFGIPNLERVVSNFLEGGSGITAIRNVEFDKNYLWTVDFISGGDSITPPAPFDKLFPASDVSMGVANSSSMEQEMGQSSIKFPYRQSARDISVTFYDDDKRTLLKWFQDWINLDIYNDGQFVSGLEDKHKVVTGLDSFGRGRNVKPVRQIRLALLDSWRNNIKIYDFNVVPEGEINFAGSQDSTASSYTVNFNIVENLSKIKSPREPGLGFNDVKKLLGRFV